MKAKSTNKIFFFLFSLFMFSSCKNEHYTLINAYVVNTTKSEYLVCLDYRSFFYDMTNKLSIVEPETSKQIIDTYLINDDTRYLGGNPFYAWVYNRSDSTYTKIDSRDLFKPDCKYGRVEIRKTKQDLPTLIEDVYITINDLLLSHMTKNTHLTDSVFGLKK